MKLEHVKAGYGHDFCLQDISLTFQPGKISMICGPNGSGKSTLVKAACHLLPRMSGHVSLDGVSLSDMTNRQRAEKIGLLDQRPVHSGMNVFPFVLYGQYAFSSFLGRYTRAQREEAWQALCAVGMELYANRSLHALSQGQKQKVCLAQIVCQDPQVVFMDEPASALDASSQFELLALARRMADAGKTVVMVLHDLPAVLDWADEIFVLQQGRLVFQGDAAAFCKEAIDETVFSVRLVQAQAEKTCGWLCIPLENLDPLDSKEAAS